MALNLKLARPTALPSGPGTGAVRFSSLSASAFHAFSGASLQFETVRSPDSGQWTVLLGDNGTGKTTLLRTLARTLSAHAPNKRSAITWSIPFPPTDEDDGVRVTTFHALIQPRTGPDAGRRAAPELQDYEFDLFAYGSTRGNAQGGHDRDVPLDETSGWETLFSPSARLIHAETWLRREKLRATGSGRFLEGVLATVGSLLPGSEKLLIVGDQILVETPSGQRFPFAAMSDGYLTTLGWTLDLIARWADRYRDTGKLDENFAKDMPCVVLVDELDLHLHPRWQLDIITRLRAAFPKTTFVVTTHNPLTLQGARPGEVFVLERGADGQIGITQRDITPGLDANRILTDWFGLPTTLDNDTRDLMAEHLRLLWEKVPPNNAKRRALEQTLRDRLGRYADTSLERIAQSVVAEVLHKKAGGPLADITPADRSEIVAQFESKVDALDAPATVSTAREPDPTWRRSPKQPKARSKKAAPAKKPASRKARAKR